MLTKKQTNKQTNKDTKKSIENNTPSPDVLGTGSGKSGPALAGTENRLVV